MKNTKVRGIAVFILCALLVMGLVSSGFSGGAPEEEKNNSSGSSDLFTDVPESHWAYENLKYLVNRGIVEGFPSGKYEGDAALSRYGAAAMIARAIKYLQSNSAQAGQQDIDALKDLLFKTSEKLQSLEAKVNRLESGQGNLGTLESKVSQNQQDIAALNQKLSQSESSADVSKIRKQVDANFIISLTGLFVGIVAIALATIA